MVCFWMNSLLKPVNSALMLVKKPPHANGLLITAMNQYVFCWRVVHTYKLIATLVLQGRDSAQTKKVFDVLYCTEHIAFSPLYMTPK